MANHATNYIDILNNSFTGIIALQAIRDINDQIVDFEYLFVNQKAQKMLHKTEKELLGNTILTVFPGHTQVTLWQDYINAVENDEVVDTEMYYPYENVAAWYRVVATKSQDGLVVHFLDITKQYQYIEALKNTERIYAKLVNTLEDITVMMYDENLKITFIEGDPVALLKGDEQGLKGQYLDEILRDNYKEDFLGVAKEAIEGKEAHFEKQIKGVMYEVRIQPIIDPMGRKEGLLVLENIQRFKEIERELKYKLLELESTNQNLEQFAYVASHDLQEPLRKIRAFGDRLVNKFQLTLPEQGQDYVKRMQNAAQRMQMLIEDLLQFSRVARSTDNFTLVDLQEVFDTVLDDLEISIDEAKANISCFSQLPKVKGDASQLKQVFQNIISNAIKFTKPNEKATITINSKVVSGKVLEEKWRQKVLQPHKSFYEIVIKDNGIGFDNKYKEKIFTIFQRLHGKTAFEGTGIGLAICKKVIENHEGYLFADGQEGKGATFIIILPFFKL